jgi:type VI secretion system protein ImpJ
MHNLAVHWHEGLFLRPQHLQAWDRHWHEVTTAAERWQRPYSYGLAQIAINQDALAAGFFQLDALRAKMLDGTLVELQLGEGSQRIDLRAALDALEEASGETLSLEGNRGIDVFLAIPRLQLGDCNVSQPQRDRVARFLATEREVPDDADGNSVEPIIFRRLNARLMISGEDLAGYETLKIARVMRQRRGGAIATLDTQYIPPLLDCAAWPALRQDLLRPIHDSITAKAGVLAQLMRDHSLDTGRNAQSDLQRVLVLQSLNQAVAVLSVLTQAGGVHPLTAYTEVARIAGGLDILNPDQAATPVAAYDHEAIGPLFAALRTRIEQRLRGTGAVPYQQRFLSGAQWGTEEVPVRGLRATVPSDWLQSDRRCLLGIQRGSLTSGEIDQLISPGHLDWKLGSADQVEALFTQRMRGVELTAARDIPKFLPSPAEWSYFEFQQRGSAWSEVVRSGTLAMRFRQSLLDAQQSWNGARTIRLKFQGRFVPLQFALFSFARSQT